MIFDHNAADARPIRIGYITTEERFCGLPEDEILVTTYGKAFPPGSRTATIFATVPQLMMAPTKDGQANPMLIEERDHRLGVSTSHKRQNRADTPTPDVAPGANAWESGRAVRCGVQAL